MKPRKIMLTIAGCLALALPLWGAPVPGEMATTSQEGTERGFPVLRDLNGNKLADGDFSQWTDGGRLRIKVSYCYDPTHSIEENAAFLQVPTLVQEDWSWCEVQNGQVSRRFHLDLLTGKAEAEQASKNKVYNWSKQVRVQPGRTFAGTGFILAIRKNRERLLKGEQIRLNAVGFTPEPRVVSVRISHGSIDQMMMANRVLRGDRFVIHPEIPKIARLFIKVPDTYIWLVNPPPAGFLRWEGPQLEPTDPVMRIDLFPGGRSGPAEPLAQN